MNTFWSNTNPGSAQKQQDKLWCVAPSKRSAWVIQLSCLGWKPVSNSLASHCGKVTQQPALPAVNCAWKSDQLIHVKLACSVTEPWQALGTRMNSYVLVTRNWNQIYISVQAVLWPLPHDMLLQFSILLVRRRKKRDFPRNQSFSEVHQGQCHVQIQAPGAEVQSHSSSFKLHSGQPLNCGPCTRDALLLSVFLEMLYCAKVISWKSRDKSLLLICIPFIF